MVIVNAEQEQPHREAGLSEEPVARETEALRRVDRLPKVTEPFEHPKYEPWEMKTCLCLNLSMNAHSDHYRQKVETIYINC